MTFGVAMSTTPDPQESSRVGVFPRIRLARQLLVSYAAGLQWER